MQGCDFTLQLVVYLQPPLLGGLLFLACRASLAGALLYSRGLGTRQRLKSVQFFECAAYSRLVGELRYGLQALGLLVAFILYDVDLFFFVAEVLAWEQWVWGQVFLCVAYVAFFVAGVLYDVSQFGLLWTE